MADSYFLENVQQVVLPEAPHIMETYTVSVATTQLQHCKTHPAGRQSTLTSAT
jgi:hypothetical protein